MKYCKTIKKLFNPEKIEFGKDARFYSDNGLWVQFAVNSREHSLVNKELIALIKYACLDDKQPSSFVGVDKETLKTVITELCVKAGSNIIAKKEKKWYQNLI